MSGRGVYERARCTSPLFFVGVYMPRGAGCRPCCIWPQHAAALRVCFRPQHAAVHVFVFGRSMPRPYAFVFGRSMPRPYGLSGLTDQLHQRLE